MEGQVRTQHICDCVEQALLEKTKQWENVVECIRVINVNIRDLQLEIKRAVDEFTGDYYYVLVCCHFIYGRPME